VTSAAHAVEDAPQLSLLDEALIRYRRTGDRQTMHATLPEVLVALAADEVSDFPALRPHQRHPWHAFLCQLGALALHGADAAHPFDSPDQWRDALLALTPSDPDGAPWCLVAPVDRPALLQPPVPEGSTANWKSTYRTADELDMLVTSKNHDLKAARIAHGGAEHWLFALLSLQTQDGYPGSGNYGVSRMNGGSSSRPGVGIAPVGQLGKRWRRDTELLVAQRQQIAELNGLRAEGGLSLIWTVPWDGTTRLDFASLDPLYIEVCRRVRLCGSQGGLSAVSTTSRVSRVDSSARNGRTGDAWTPVNNAKGVSLTLGPSGFDYRLVAELVFGNKYTGGVAQSFSAIDALGRLQLVAQCIVRGQSTTEGYFERLVPLPQKVRTLLSAGHKDQLARVSSERIAAISAMRTLIWSALITLFSNGASSVAPNKAIENRATRFCRPFEQIEDSRFFADLFGELEAPDSHAARLGWLVALAARAELVLRDAFAAGPRSAIQRYRAQSAALSRFHGALRGEKSPLPQLAQHLRQKSTRTQEQAPS